jgi:hypothetical protein
MKFLEFLSDADKDYIENFPQAMIIKSAFTVTAATDGTITASIMNDRLNGKHLLINIDNSTTDKTSDDGGCTYMRRDQVDDLIKALMILRREL